MKQTDVRLAKDIGKSYSKIHQYNHLNKFLKRFPKLKEMGLSPQLENRVRQESKDPFKEEEPPKVTARKSVDVLASHRLGVKSYRNYVDPTTVSDSAQSPKAIKVNDFNSDSPEILATN